LAPGRRLTRPPEAVQSRPGLSMPRTCFLAALAVVCASGAGAGRVSTLEFLNAAGNGVTLMRGCESWGHYAPGQGRMLNFTAGANKLWVVPDGCTQAEGCYPCHLDCLGCFYLSAVVAANGAIVAGIGYGHNDPVVVHGRVGNATLTATNQWNRIEAVTCSVSACDVEHIIQARAGTGRFTVGFLPLLLL